SASSLSPSLSAPLDFYSYRHPRHLHSFPTRRSSDLTEIKEKEMTFQTFLIKYGEIAIKGKNRYMFEDALVRQIRFALRNTEGTFRVHKCQGRIYVDCDGYYDYDETVESLKKVFGIVG